jgi:hypothetical protein
VQKKEGSRLEGCARVFVSSHQSDPEVDDDAEEIVDRSRSIPLSGASSRVKK